MSNIQINNNTNSEETTMNTTDVLIAALVNHFQDNPQSFTEYRKEVEALLRDNIKPLSSRSGKSGDDWRAEVKSQFSGRGAKWVFIALQDIEPTLVQFEDGGIDCSNYRKNITKLGKAWIRFSGPRVKDGINSAAFEVRTEGSTIDHPKQIHMIPADILSNVIEVMPGTPKSLKIEEDSEPMPNAKARTLDRETTNESSLNVGTIASEINKELEAEVVLNESPQSDDPAEWEAFLAAEGLIDHDLEDILDDNEF